MPWPAPGADRPWLGQLGLALLVVTVALGATAAFGGAALQSGQTLAIGLGLGCAALAGGLARGDRTDLAGGVLFGAGTGLLYFCLYAALHLGAVTGEMGLTGPVLAPALGLVA